jgi:hypothetical protein
VKSAIRGSPERTTVRCRDSFFGQYKTRGWGAPEILTGLIAIDRRTPSLEAVDVLPVFNNIVLMSTVILAAFQDASSNGYGSIFDIVLRLWSTLLIFGAVGNSKESSGVVC